MPKQSQQAFATLAFIYLSAIYFLTNAIERHQTPELFFGFFAVFFAYLWMGSFEKRGFFDLFILGILARVAAGLSLPNLSDDFYRFLWDGILLTQGHDPYSLIPSAVSYQTVRGLDAELLDKLNSPHYFSVYPPLNQFIFGIAARVSDNYFVFVSTIRALFLLIEAGFIFFLYTKKYPGYLLITGWYFLNPLVIIEGIGNLHFEILVVPLAGLGIFFYEKNKNIVSGLFWGLAAATKLVPLIYLPSLLLGRPLQKRVFVIIISILVLVVSLVPMLSSALAEGMMTSISLYFQKFEFNASIYFLLKEIGLLVKGYNLIQTLGPWLAAIIFFLIMSLAVLRYLGVIRLKEALLFSLTIYLLFSTTVHPWYLLPLIFFGILAGYRYPVAWSAAVVLSYFGYTENGYDLSTKWLILEYILVIGFMFFEIWSKYAKNRQTHTSVSDGRS